MSRQPKLTDDARDLYLRAVSAGVPPEVAAVHAGFSRATLRRRLQGRTPRDAEFRVAHDRALAAFQITLVATVARAALTDPRLALELLTRRFSTDWARSRSVDSLDDVDDRTQPAADTPIALDPALIEELVPRLLEAGRRLSGQPVDEMEDLSEFADDGCGPLPQEDGDDE